jgi:hypothetical protein
VLLAAACSSTGSTATATRPPVTSTPPATVVTTPAPAGTLRPVADEGKVTYSVTLTPGECRTRDAGTLPDPHCTPGATDPKVTQASIRVTICARGWTATVRPPDSQTSHAKFTIAYPAYSIGPGVTSELDHLVPLELGGANDITNLWPEAGKVPNSKDPVENALHTAVCAGKVTLAAAQAAIAANWHTAEQVTGA